MDSISQMVKPKRQKLDGGERKGLNDLPDVVIEKIISLLPTQEAIRTSLLSKRWEYLWTSIPRLDFYAELNTKRPLVVNIVDRALFLRGPADIKRFHLSFHVLGDASRVNAWISAVVRRNVEDLTIVLDTHKEPFPLPQCLLTSASVKKLLLHLPWSFKVSSASCFSSLRSLTLMDVEFHDEYSIQLLFSGCPVLEKLKLLDCIWSNLKFVSICAPNLRKLTINESEFGISEGSNLCQIMVFGVSLNYFSYSVHQLVHDYCLRDSSVHEACIDIDAKGSRLTSYLFHKLLKGLSSVKYLSISHFDFEVALNGAPELLAQMPMFINLTNLRFRSGAIRIDCKLLWGVFRCCPCLQELEFYAGIDCNGNDIGMLDPLPQCFLTSLKEIEVRGFNGSKDEVCALSILLKNAMVLEKMYMKSSADELELEKERDPNKKRDLHKQISDLPKGSECCEVFYSVID